MRACQLPLGKAAGKDIVTIEGLSADSTHPLQQAWVALDVPQCGYCQSGMLMAAAALLTRNPAPSESEVRQAITNLCRCGTYARISAAIMQAAALMRGEASS